MVYIFMYIVIKGHPIVNKQFEKSLLFNYRLIKTFTFQDNRHNFVNIIENENSFTCTMKQGHMNQLSIQYCIHVTTH